MSLLLFWRPGHRRWSRTAAETTNLVDTATREVAYSRSAPDLLAMADSTTHTFDATRRADDAATLADLARRQVDFSRLGPEATALADSASRSASLTYTSTDTNDQQVDSASYELVISRTGSEQQGETDSAFFSMAYNRIAEDFSKDFFNEQIGFAYRTVAYHRSIVEQVAEQIDAAFPNKIQYRSTDDTHGMSDSTARQVSYRATTSDLSTLADLASRMALFQRLATDVVRPHVDQATRSASYRRHIDIYLNNYFDNALSKYIAERTSVDSQIATDVAQRRIDFKRIARDLNLALDSASRVVMVSRRSNEIDSQLDRALRQVFVDRATSDSVPSATDTAVRFVLFPRRGSESVSMAEQVARTVTYSRQVQEILESADVASRFAVTSRLGAEQIATEDTTSRSLTVIRLGAEESVATAVAARSALLSRLATETVRTDLTSSRSIMVERLTEDLFALADSTFHALLLDRTSYDVVGLMEDEAARERLYRTDTQRFPHPYDLDLSTGRVYDILTGRSRPMVLDLSSSVAVVMQTTHDEVYVLETGSGLWAVLTTDTEE